MSFQIVFLEPYNDGVGFQARDTHGPAGFNWYLFNVYLIVLLSFIIYEHL